VLLDGGGEAGQAERAERDDEGVHDNVLLDGGGEAGQAERGVRDDEGVHGTQAETSLPQGTGVYC